MIGHWADVSSGYSLESWEYEYPDPHFQGNRAGFIAGLEYSTDGFKDRGRFRYTKAEFSWNRFVCQLAHLYPNIVPPPKKWILWPFTMEAFTSDTFGHRVVYGRICDRCDRAVPLTRVPPYAG